MEWCHVPCIWQGLWFCCQCPTLETWGSFPSWDPSLWPQTGCCCLDRFCLSSFLQFFPGIRAPAVPWVLHGISLALLASHLSLHSPILHVPYPIPTDKFPLLVSCGRLQGSALPDPCGHLVITCACRADLFTLFWCEHVPRGL